MFRRLCLSVCLLPALVCPLRAQDSGSAANVQLVNAIFQDDEQESALPPVEVRPPRSTGNYRSSNPFPGGTVPWSSGAIDSDTQLVGPYDQPVWTTQRPWATTRVYVLPPGQMQVEQWVRPTYRRNGDKPKFRFLEEYAVGLPGRFQLDLYERWNVEPSDTNREQANHEGVQVELRYALADWGVLPLNPTLYIEWVEKGGPQDKPNVYEIKLLAGDEILPNWYYATNLVLEQETAGEREQELAWSHALSTTVIDRLLLAGVEMNLTSTTVHGARGEPEVGFTIGPSLQLRPTNRTFIDAVGLFGCTDDSPAAQLYFIFGYQFGSRAAPSVAGPRSTIGN